MRLDRRVKKSPALIKVVIFFLLKRDIFNLAQKRPKMAHSSWNILSRPLQATTNDMELKSTPLCFQVLFKAQVFCNQIESYYVLTSSLSFIQESVWCCHDYLHGSTKVAFSRDLTIWKVFLKHENLYRLSFPKSYTIWPSTMNRFVGSQSYYIIGQGKGNRNKWHFFTR